MKQGEIKIRYKPKEIIGFLRAKRKSSFTVQDLKECFGEDESFAAWVLHDLTTLRILRSEHHDIEYIGGIPYKSFRLIENKEIEDLPEREATFKRPL